MATFFKPSPSILFPSSSIRPDLSLKRVDASRSARPAHYFDPSFPNDNGAVADVEIEARPESRTLVAVGGCFTEKKAKQLRQKTAEGYTFHDGLYHSAITPRLATDVSFPIRFESLKGLSCIFQ